MPMPRPKAGESKEKFLDRCMGADIMVDDFPDNKQRYAVCNAQWKKAKQQSSKEDKEMAVNLNGTGNANARGLIKAGKVNSSASWSFSAADGNKLLGDDNWGNYAKWFLAIETGAEPKTKQRFKYPFGKGGSVYRSAIRAIRSRSAQQGHTAVFEAAGRLMSMMDEGQSSIERRFVQADGLEVRAQQDDQPAKLIGYAARFGELSEDLGGFREKIARGAFKDTIKDDDIRALWNHNSDYVLGRSSAGTLALQETRAGLKIDVDMPDTQWARDLAVSIGRGDVSQMSFGFRSIKDEWDDSDRDHVVRTLRKVELFDVSPVTYPAYPQTSVQTRNLERALETAGVDLNIVNRTLLKIEHGLEILDDDRRAIDDVIVRLGALIAAGQSAADEGGSGESPMSSAARLRRRLELKVKEEV